MGIKGWIYDNWDEYVGKLLIADNPYVDVWMHPPKITLTEDIPGKYRELGLWGGWQHASFVVDPGVYANGYISRTPMPKFTPLVRVEKHGILSVAGWPLAHWVTYKSKAIMEDIKDVFYNASLDFRTFYKNHRDGTVPDPVSRSTQRQEWVELAMYEMGMRRSNYNPNPVADTPYVNVGTVGHIDIGRTRSSIGPQNIEEYQEWARDWLEENDPTKQRPTIGGLFLGKSK